MRKFCKKCGTKLEETTGLCPNCTAERERERREKLTIRQRIRRLLMKLVIGAIIFVILILIGTGILIYLGIFEVQVAPDKTAMHEVTQEAANVDDCYTPNEENIVYEDDSHSFGYVNNMVLLFVDSDASENRIDEIAASLGGEVIGKIKEIHQYQIQTDPMSREELEAICEEAMKFEEVKYAIVDDVFAIEYEENQVPNDPWKDESEKTVSIDWNEDDPSGRNWWLEATHVLSAWQYTENGSGIPVGVVDNGFDTSHEDLKITVLNESINNPEHHGTHVAGIIGATTNNGKGINGVLKQADLYGVDIYKTDRMATSTAMRGIILCIAEGCKVVNLSSGIMFTNSGDTRENAYNSARVAVTYLICMLEEDSGLGDFIIVNSAGNDGVDSREYNGFFASIDENMIEHVLDLYYGERSGTERTVTVQDILDSYIVVGAVDKKKKNGNWQLAWFSNYGEAVTVCAPGVDIFSTTVMGGQNGKNYADDEGTSMAAPIVAGITAMVWGVNPEMDSGTVKELITETADSVVLSRRWADDDTYHMVNARAAMESAVKYREQLNETAQSDLEDASQNVSAERDIVLVLDTSGSMSGIPMEETKKASVNFIDTILEEEASIGIVTYDNNAGQLSGFSTDKDSLIEIASAISDGGGTNIEAGLAEAKSMLDSSNARKKIIVLMSDGEPNRGKEGEELIAYADEIKSDDVLIYTLGFFENIGGNKSSAQYLMEQLASDGCHYEVVSADDLVFFFEDMADQINGQKYIYIRIACPVDVSVTYNGEILNSAKEDQVLRTDFGTLTFEDRENTASGQEDNQIKVLRLKEGADYDVKIIGTGRGIMNYTIGFMDENGSYSDFRRFEDIKITKQTVIDTVATVSSESVLNIDEDGDGKYELKLRATENGYGEEIKIPTWILYAIGVACILLLVDGLIITVLILTRKKREEKF